jgi:hypothetical protein
LCTARRQNKATPISMVSGAMVLKTPMRSDTALGRIRPRVEPALKMAAM